MGEMKVDVGAKARFPIGISNPNPYLNKAIEKNKKIKTRHSEAHKTE